MQTYIWWIGACAVVAAIAILQARGGIVVYLGALLFPYAYLQVSSWFSLVPFYKDGGNGYPYIDLFPWLVMAALVNLVVALGLAIVRRLRR